MSAKDRVADVVEALREEKFNARRIELAEAALATLGELGYARTSLREIAQKSEFTHGVFHYYFADKLDLICCCVRHYKAKCVTRYDEVTATARSREALLEGFASKLAETLRDDASMHRLWYDLRAQALFEDAFRGDVLEIDQSLENMVWRIASRYAELGGKTPVVSPGVLYALFDGLFQRYLLKHLADDASAVPDMVAEVKRLLPSIC
ncbi:TetR/AcrR family transcriptional regulator [Bradyrhizobium sp. 2TAF24]|uniref:TetR/AcrR family transcriptional regulator n=1 Tax=Bradyrhizobium sp. 2TAF24 TaxID=3233011 RepID=UPI003F9246C7